MKKFLLIAAAALSLSACDSTAGWHNPFQQQNVAVPRQTAPAQTVVSRDVMDQKLSSTAPIGDVAPPTSLTAAPRRPSLIVDAGTDFALPAASSTPACAPQTMSRPVCVPHEVSSIFISFQYPRADIGQLSEDIDARVADIKAHAARLGITSVEIAELNYNVSNGRSGNAFRRLPPQPALQDGQYMVGGRLRFNVLPVSKAPALVKWLSENKDYHVNLNVQTSNCPQVQ